MLVGLGPAAPAVLAASPEPFPSSGPSHTCPRVKVPQIYPGFPSSGIGPQEIDEFGHPTPTCGFADHLVRLAPRRIHEHKWGRVNGWNCVWVVAFEECKTHGVRIYAANPGD